MEMMRKCAGESGFLTDEYRLLVGIGMRRT